MFAIFLADRVRVADLRLGIEDVVQPAHRSAAALEDIGHESQRDHGKDQARHERVKRDQFAERDPAQNHKPPALPEHEHKRQPDQHLEQRHEQAPEVDQTQVAIDIFAVRPVEAADFGFLLPVGAHHAHAGQIFLRLCGKHRERSLNLSVERMNLLPENPHDDGDDGDGKQNVDAEPSPKSRTSGPRRAPWSQTCWRCT